MLILNLLALSVDDFTLLISYAFYALIIFVALALIGVFKKKEKRLLSPKTVKARCEAAATFAEELIAHKKGHLMMATTKLAKLSSMISEAEWLALRLVEDKKDIDFDGIAKTLDTLATDVNNKSTESFISTRELNECLEETHKKLKSVIGSLDALISHREELLEV